MINIKPQSLLLTLLIAGVVASFFYGGNSTWQVDVEVLRDSVILTWIVSLVNILILGNGLGRLLGILPRKLIGLLGIVFSPLLHRDIGHLIANTVPFLVLGWLVLLQRELPSGGENGVENGGDFYAITATILLIGGFGTWLLGREAIHLGASGLIFGYIGFLLVQGYVGPTALTIGLALIVFMIYGSQLRGMLPSANEERVSWEGHLFGFIGGIVAGVYPEFLAALGAAINRLVQP